MDNSISLNRNYLKPADNINCYYEPTNPLEWSLFDGIKSVGQISSFRATSEMKVGDIVLLSIGKQLEMKNSLGIIRPKGVYAIGIVVSEPYILNNPVDANVGKLVANISIIKIRKDKPIKNLDNLSDNYRSVNKIKEEHYDRILTVMNN